MLIAILCKDDDLRESVISYFRDLCEKIADYIFISDTSDSRFTEYVFVNATKNILKNTIYTEGKESQAKNAGIVKRFAIYSTYDTSIFEDMIRLDNSCYIDNNNVDEDCEFDISFLSGINNNNFTEKLEQFDDYMYTVIDKNNSKCVKLVEKYKRKIVSNFTDSKDYEICYEDNLDTIKKYLIDNTVF